MEPSRLIAPRNRTSRTAFLSCLMVAADYAAVIRRPARMTRGRCFGRQQSTAEA